jgi:group I intron endonuclease
VSRVLFKKINNSIKGDTIMSFIYQWTNIINGKKYLGKHLGSVDDNYVGSGKAFMQAVEKYGLENFVREIIEFTEPNILTEREQYYLDLYDCANSSMYYNISPTSSGGNLGHDYSLSTKKAADTNRKNGTYEKLSARMKENNPSKNGVWNKGKNINSRGTPIADWERKMHSERMKKNNPNASGDQNKKTTYVNSVDGTESFEFNSLTEAEKFISKHTGKLINHASVWNNMKKNRPYKGYIWTYTI